ncbi:MAG TPA: hypothetical protein VIT90_14270 [Lysobacter sp.]
MGRDLILMLALICAIGGYVVFQDHRVNSAEARAEAAEDKATRLDAELQQSRLSVRVVTEFVDRVQIVRERAATITKEIPVYVTAEADARCHVPVGFVRVHDAAAQNLPLDRPAGDPDAPAAGVTLSAVADTVADNYGACNETREQLIGLQEWLRGRQAIPQP